MSCSNLTSTLTTDRLSAEGSKSVRSLYGGYHNPVPAPEQVGDFNARHIINGLRRLRQEIAESVGKYE